MSESEPGRRGALTFNRNTSGTETAHLFAVNIGGSPSYEGEQVLWAAVYEIMGASTGVYRLAAGLCANSLPSYTSVADGSWNSSSTWTPNTGFPDSGHTAIITGGDTVKLTADQQAGVLNFSGSGIVTSDTQNRTLTLGQGNAAPPGAIVLNCGGL